MSCDKAHRIGYITHYVFLALFFSIIRVFSHIRVLRMNITGGDHPL